MGYRPHRLGGDSGQISSVGSRLVPVHLLQREDVGVQEPDRRRETVKVDPLVGYGAAVQDVERRQPHGKKVLITASVGHSEGSTGEESGLRTALKHSAAALKRDGVSFALGGSYALWAYGGPEPEHDVDLVVPESAVSAAKDSLVAAGFEVEQPPEDWLFKAYLDGDLVDVLFRLGGVEVNQDMIEGAAEMELLGLRIPVLPPTPIMIAKLRSLSEHYCDFGALLPVFRAVREQLDWAALAAANDGHPFAEAFLFLLDRLGIVEPAAPTTGRSNPP
jgi:hypothetical protein